MLVLLLVGICARRYVEISRNKHWVTVEREFDETTNSVLKKYDDTIAREIIDVKENVNGKADNVMFTEQISRMIAERQIFLNGRIALKNSTKGAIIGTSIFVK
jgi:hypothetical protein